MEKTSSSDFYEALRKTQPFAFLASFSLIIGIISTANESSLPPIQSDAIIAGFMFIFAFITSIISQVFKEFENIKKFTEYTQYFFFGIGIVYFVFIALKFSETLLQIPTLFVGWLIISLGIYFFSRLYPVKKKFWNRKKMLNEIEDKIAYPLIGIAFFTVGGSFVASALFEQTLDWNPIVLWSIIFGVTGLILYFVCEIARLVLSVRRSEKK